MPSINQLIQDIPSLASYDAVLRELEEVLNDPESTLADVCIIIETDPVLTAKLLKLGNSCFFGFSKRVETVFETISLIGIQQVRDLVAASAVMRMFDRVSADHLNPEAFWRHSLACGVASRNLAIALRCPKPEKYFVAGLLHDIGRLVLVFQAPDTAEEIFRHYHQSRMLLRDAEKELLGFNHADIGAALLKVWNYPGNLIQSVSYHHNPMLAGEFPREACLVHVADHLVNAMQLGSAGERLIPPLDLSAWNRLGMTTELLEPVMKSIDEQLVAVEQAFLTAKTTPTDSPKEKLHGKVHLS